MAIARLDIHNDATWQRAWVIDTLAELATFALTYAAPFGPKRGDFVLCSEDSNYYIFVNNNIYVNISGGSSGGFTQGSVPFADSGGNLTEDNAELFFDETDKLLGVGTNAPEFKLEVGDEGDPIWGGRGATSFTTLTANFNISDTQMDVASTTGFPEKGIVSIENEIIFYNGKTGTTLDNCVRNRLNTTEVNHNSGASVVPYHFVIAQSNIAGEAILFSATGRLYVNANGNLNEIPTSSSIATIKLGSQFTIGGTYGVVFGNVGGQQAFFGVTGASAYFGSVSNDPVIFRVNNTQYIWITTDGRMLFHGTTSGEPALKRNGAVLEVKLADNSDFAELKGKKITISDGTQMMTSSAAMSNGAAGSTGTLTNAPAAGDPTKWIPFNDNGTTRYIPAW